MRPVTEKECLQEYNITKAIRGMHLVGQQQPPQSAFGVQYGNDWADNAGGFLCSHNAVCAEVHFLLLHIELDGQILKRFPGVLLVPQSLPQSPVQTQNLFTQSTNVSYKAQQSRMNVHL